MVEADLVVVGVVEIDVVEVDVVVVDMVEGDFIEVDVMVVDVVEIVDEDYLMNDLIRFGTTIS